MPAISPMLELLNVLLRTEEALRQTRDLLLPRLLLGQVVTCFGQRQRRVLKPAWGNAPGINPRT
ncbi:MAG: hypothetical protein ACYDH9_18720 [Limisphaerales bacterium]